MEVKWYQSKINHQIKAFLSVGFGNYPYIRELGKIKKLTHREKVRPLVEILNNHHPDTLSHTFEDAFFATILAQDYFIALGLKLGWDDKKIYEEFMPKIEKVFLGALFHDIGKTAVPNYILNDKTKVQPKQKEILNMHSQLGSEILNRVGLSEFAFFCREHHIGNSNGLIFKHIDFLKRSGLTEFISLSDGLSGMRDSRRGYHNNDNPTKTIEEVIEKILQKHDQGTFSTGLIRSFYRVVVDRNLYPPFFNTKTFEKSSLFMGLIKKHNIMDIMSNNMVDRRPKK